MAEAEKKASEVDAGGKPAGKKVPAARREIPGNLPHLTAPGTLRKKYRVGEAKGEGFGALIGRGMTASSGSG